jgi:uncharacterized protein (DUF885 family)
MRRRYLPLLPLALLLPLGCAPTTTITNGGGAPAPAAAAATAAENTRQLNAWLDEVFRAELARSPQAQTQFGMIEDLEAYGRWDDASEAAALASRERQRGYIQQMRERFDPATLSEAGRTTFRFTEYQHEIGERLWEVRESAFVFSPMLDAISGITTFLINAHRVSEPAHAEAYISRLQGMGPLIDTLVTRAENRHTAGTRLPRFAYPRLMASARGLLGGAPFEAGAADGPLLADFRAKVAALDLPEAEQAALVSRAEAALVEVYRPAIDRYTAALQRMERDAPQHGGARSLPNGEDFYATQVALFTTRDDLTPAQIHRDRSLGGGADPGGDARDHGAGRLQGTLQDFFEHLRTDDRFYYPDSPEGRQRYLDESTRYIEQVMEVAPRFFNRLPRARLEVRAVEPFREETASGAFYNQPTLDGSRPGYYYVNLATCGTTPST